MKQLLRICLLVCISSALLLLSGCSETLVSHVAVMVTEGEGYTVAGENPRSVQPGESVSFQLGLEEGWSLVLPDGTISEDGVYTLARVLYPTTIVPDVRLDVEYFTLEICDPTVRGTLTSTAAPGELIAGTEVTISAEPKEEYTFLCWTGKEKSDVRSKDAVYTFTMEEDTVLYPRYVRKEDPVAKINVATLIYNANGGICTLPGQKDGIYYEEVDVSQFKLPNCMGGFGQFVREGYHLVEYNTKPDGTGMGYSLGSKIILDTGIEKKSTEILYCIWKKETDATAFTYTEAKGEITITGYTGKDEELVIPTHIDGKPVTKLAKNALVGCSFTLLSLPDTMVTVERDAILDCESFTTLYFPDSIIGVNDNSIRNCPNWQYFNLNAEIPPRYGPGMLIKMEKVITTQDKNRVVVLSGSSSLYGLDSEILSAALDDQYYVINHGTNGSCNSAVYMAWYQQYLHEGDILVQAPEHSDPQLGSLAVNWKIYRELEMFYNVFRYLDAREFTFFAGFQEFQKTRQSMKETKYNIHSNSRTEHGDFIGTGTYLKLNSPKYHSGGSFGYSTKSITPAFVKALNDCHAALRKKGVVVYMSFAPHNYNALTKQSREASYKEAYTQFFRDNLTIPVISSLGDYTQEGQYFYDSDWHLNSEGRRIRSEQLGKDLRAQLIKDGILK